MSVRDTTNDKNIHQWMNSCCFAFPFPGKKNKKENKCLCEIQQMTNNIHLCTMNSCCFAFHIPREKQQKKTRVCGRYSQ